MGTAIKSALCIAALCVAAMVPGAVAAGRECVTQAQFQAINEESGYWPKCDPSSSKTNEGPPGYVFGMYCTQEWVDGLNEVLEYLGYCDDGLTIRKFLAQIAYETGYYSTLGQPLDDGSGLIHMIPGNFRRSAEHMEEVFPGQGLLAAYESTADKQAFFKDPKYAWKSAAAWMKLTNGVIPGCGFDLFPASLDDQTRCILSRVVDRMEEYELVSRHIPCTGSCEPCNGPCYDGSGDNGSGLPTIRCGRDWSDANTKCGNTCVSDSECPAGEGCFANLADVCSDNGGNADNGDNSPSPSPPIDTGFRCGAGWADANTKCGMSCASNEDCPSGEECYNGMSPDPCNGASPQPSPAPPSPSPPAPTPPSIPDNGGNGGQGLCGTDGKWPTSSCFAGSTGACRNPAGGACFELPAGYDQCYAGTVHCKDGSRRRLSRRLMSDM